MSFSGRVAAMRSLSSTSRPSVRTAVDPALVISLAIGAWAVLAALGGFHSAVLPSPAQVWSVLGDRWLSLVGSLLETMSIVFIGLAIGASVGVVSAVVLHYSPWFNRALYPYLVASFVVPKPVLIPLLLLWVGVNPTYKTIVVILFALFPVTENTLAGLRMVDSSLMELGRSLKMSPARVARHISLPAAMPMIVAGLRIALAEAFVGAIVAETLAPHTGIGSRIMQAAAISNTSLILAGIAVIAAAGVVMYVVVDVVERRLLHWQLQPAKGPA